MRCEKFTTATYKFTIRVPTKCKNGADVETVRKLITIYLYMQYKYMLMKI
jgi:hypothetical protein